MKINVNCDKRRLRVTVFCRTPITVTTLALLTVIQHQPLQRAPATDFCTFTCIIFRYIMTHGILSQVIVTCQSVNQSINQSINQYAYNTTVTIAYCYTEFKNTSKRGVNGRNADSIKHCDSERLIGG